MKARYQQAMERLYLACVIISGGSLIVITLVIPYGVFTRYVLNAPSSWPEPLAILLMIVFTFIGGAAVYRAKVHMAIRVFLDAVGPDLQKLSLFVADLLVAVCCLFMVWYGLQLVATTWRQSIAEFPGLSVGITYLPIPAAGFLTLLFLVESLWLGPPPETSVIYKDQPQAE